MSAEPESQQTSVTTKDDDSKDLMRGPEILLHPPLSEFQKQQSVALRNQPEIRRSPRVPEGQFLSTMFSDVHTVHEIFMHGYNSSKTLECLGRRSAPGQPYTWLTYQQVYKKIEKVGSGLLAKGLKADTCQFVGIFSQNNVEWVVMDRACSAYSMVSVPLYDTLGEEALTHIVHQCELKTILIDSNARARKIIRDHKEGKTSSVGLIILIEDPDDETKSLSTDAGVEVITFSDLEELGAKSLQEFVPPKPTDLYTVCYTSGTTGTPKGVMHSHLNIVSMISAFLINARDYGFPLLQSDVYISYLPLAHVFERYIQYGILMHGGRIGFYGGNPKKLLDDAVDLRPTLFPLVPRLLNRIYGKIMDAVGPSGWRRHVFNFFLSRKMSALDRGHASSDTIWDKLLFHKFQAVLGGRVRLSVTGAAPISPHVLNVVRCVMGFPIVEGYGQTETTSAITCTISGDFEGGNVGSVLPNNVIKLTDVPEKEYYAKDGKGEVCCKGQSAFLGYYKDEAKTKETIDSEGWVHTGDIGQWLPNGTLKIIDRRKNIFKLSIGEYVAPEKIEQIYMMCDAVHQVFIYGESLKSCVVAIVVPSEETFSRWCKDRGVDTKDKSFEELCKTEGISKILLDDLSKIGRENGLKSFELAKKVLVTTVQFTVENKMMTPSLKSRRMEIEKYFRSDIDDMYAGLD